MTPSPSRERSDAAGCLSHQLPTAHNNRLKSLSLKYPEITEIAHKTKTPIRPRESATLLERQTNLCLESGQNDRHTAISFSQQTNRITIYFLHCRRLFRSFPRCEDRPDQGNPPPSDATATPLAANENRGLTPPAVHPQPASKSHADLDARLNNG